MNTYMYVHLYVYYLIVCNINTPVKLIEFNLNLIMSYINHLIQQDFSILNLQ